MTVEGIAKKFNVSTSHLSRIFREHAEITLVEYINYKKSGRIPVLFTFFRRKNFRNIRSI